MGEVIGWIIGIILVVLFIVLCVMVYLALVAATLFGGGIAGVGIGIFYGFKNYFSALIGNLKLRR